MWLSKLQKSYVSFLLTILLSTRTLGSFKPSITMPRKHLFGGVLGNAANLVTYQRKKHLLEPGTTKNSLHVEETHTSSLDVSQSPESKVPFSPSCFPTSSLHEKHTMSSTDWIYDLKRCFLLIYDLKYPVIFYSLKKPVLNWKYSRNGP